MLVTGSPRNLNMADLSKLTYLEWCIKESMRLYPPVPFFARSVSADIEFGEIVISCYSIPKGCRSITVSITSLTYMYYIYQ